MKIFAIIGEYVWPYEGKDKYYRILIGAPDSVTSSFFKNWCDEIIDELRKKYRVESDVPLKERKDREEIINEMVKILYTRFRLEIIKRENEGMIEFTYIVQFAHKD